MNTSRIVVLTYDLLEDGHKDYVTMINFFLFHQRTQVGFHVAVSLYSDKPQDVT